MRLNRGSLGNPLQDEASCAIYLFLLRRRSTNETERVVEMDESRRVAVILHHDVSTGVVVELWHIDGKS